MASSLLTPDLALNGFWQKPPPGGGVRRSNDIPKKNFSKDDAIQFVKEERTPDAIYTTYLKKVQYNVDSDMCLDIADQKKAHLQWRLKEIRIIRCGTLSRLISALSSETGELESTTVSIFLSTYRTFASTKDVMDELLSWYKTVGEDSKLKQQVRESHRRTIKTILGAWLDSYSDDFYDPPCFPVLRSLQEFSEQQMKDVELSQRVVKTIKMFMLRDESSSVSSTNERVPSFIFSEKESQDLNANYFLQSFDLMSVPSDMFAEQLTFIDSELFKKVVPHHCLGSVWARRSQKNSGSNQSPSVYATVEQFNAVTYRVIATIVKEPTMPASHRALIFEKWIDIAQECRNLKNFSSLKAILAGLQSAPVYRLQEIWELVSRQKLSLYAELSAIFSEEDNQKVCRELLNKEGTAKYADSSSSRTPKRLLGWTVATKHRNPFLDSMGLSKVQGTVPYLGTFLTDLMMLDTAFKDTIEDGLINFEKRRKEFEILMQIKLLQSAASLYQIKPDRMFMKWFYNIRVYDDSESYELSCEIEQEVSIPTTPLVKGHQKKSSLGYFSSRHIPITSSMEDIVQSGGSVSSRRSHHTDPDSRSMSNMDLGLKLSPVSPYGPKLSHSSSLGSLHSIDSHDLSSSGFRSENSIAVKVYLESGENHETNHYKSILLRNSDHTRTLLLNAFLKYNITAQPEQYSIFQILSNKSELQLPEKGNAFYAINTSEFDIKCVIRKNSEFRQPAQIKFVSKMKWRKLQF